MGDCPTLVRGQAPVPTVTSGLSLLLVALVCLDLELGSSELKTIEGHVPFLPVFHPLILIYLLSVMELYMLKFSF